MVILIGDLRAGLMSMIPNLTPIVFTLGFMYWMDIPLDIFTILIGSIGIGVAVDDTVHFMHGVARDDRRLGDAKAAVEATLLTTGRAMLTTLIVLIAGFLVFTASSMANIVAFGVINSPTSVVAFLCDCVTSSSRLPWWSSSFATRRTERILQDHPRSKTPSDRLRFSPR